MQRLRITAPKERTSLGTKLIGLQRGIHQFPPRQQDFILWMLQRRTAGLEPTNRQAAELNRRFRELNVKDLV